MDRADLIVSIQKSLDKHLAASPDLDFDAFVFAASEQKGGLDSRVLNSRQGFLGSKGKCLVALYFEVRWEFEEQFPQLKDISPNDFFRVLPSIISMMDSHRAGESAEEALKKALEIQNLEP